VFIALVEARTSDASLRDLLPPVTLATLEITIAPSQVVAEIDAPLAHTVSQFNQVRVRSFSLLFCFRSALLRTDLPEFLLSTVPWQMQMAADLCIVSHGPIRWF